MADRADVMSRTLHVWVEIHSSALDAPVRSQDLGKRPVCSQRIATLPKHRFHMRTRRFKHSNSANNHCAAAQCVTVPSGVAPSDLVVSMTDRCVRCTTTDVFNLSDLGCAPSRTDT